MSTFPAEQGVSLATVYDLQFDNLPHHARGKTTRIAGKIQAMLADASVASIEEYGQLALQGGVEQKRVEAFTAFCSNLRQALEVGRARVDVDWGRVRELPSLAAPGEVDFIHTLQSGRILVRVHHLAGPNSDNGYHVLDPNDGRILVDAGVVNPSPGRAFCQYKELHAGDDDLVVYTIEHTNDSQSVWVWFADEETSPTRFDSAFGPDVIGMGRYAFFDPTNDLLHVADADEIRIMNLSGEIVKTVPTENKRFRWQMCRGITVGGDYVASPDGFKDIFLNAETLLFGMEPPFDMRYLASLPNGDMFCQRCIPQAAGNPQYADIWRYHAKAKEWLPFINVQERTNIPAEVITTPTMPDMVFVRHTDASRVWLYAMEETFESLVWSKEFSNRWTASRPHLSVSPQGRIYVTDGANIRVFGEEIV